MPKNILIANWKMSLTLEESLELAEVFSKNVSDDKLDIVLCPSPSLIFEIGKVLKDTNISLGAQNVFWEEKGAFTGEVSPNRLKKAGCKYCIVGHSERRSYLGETDEMVNKKVLALLEKMITPIICIGEKLEDREKGLSLTIVEEQLRKVLEGVKPVGNQEVIVAYEPVWAISTSGSGKVATPEQVDEINKIIKGVLLDIYPSDVVENNFRLIYGGSVNLGNIKDFVGLESVYGALVGSASMKKDFIKMMEIIKELH